MRRFKFEIKFTTTIYIALVDLPWNTSVTSEPPVLSVRPPTDSVGLNEHHYYAGEDRCFHSTGSHSD